jgi:hypothetical protein
MKVNCNAMAFDNFFLVLRFFFSETQIANKYQSIDVPVPIYQSETPDDRLTFQTRL